MPQKIHSALFELTLTACNCIRFLWFALRLCYVMFNFCFGMNGRCSQYASKCRNGMHGVRQELSRRAFLKVSSSLYPLPNNNAAHPKHKFFAAGGCQYTSQRKSQRSGATEKRNRLRKEIFNTRRVLQLCTTLRINKVL